MGMSNVSDTNASESNTPVSHANEGDANPSMATGALPVLFRGTVYTQPLSAHLAALFDQLDVQYTYHRHRLLVDTQEHAILPEFWLPQSNTFLFVYSAWPNYEQCVEHESIAKLGHSVTVLVGKQLATAVACAKPLREGEDVMHGWTLEYLTGELRPGWTAFMLVDGRVQLSNMVFPADRRAIHTSVVRALESARKAVEDSKKVPEGLSFAPEGLSFAPEGLSFAPSVDTDSELSHTLGKSLKFK